MAFVVHVVDLLGSLNRVVLCKETRPASVLTIDTVNGISSHPLSFDTVSNTCSNGKCVALSVQQPTSTWTNGFG